MTLRSPSQEQLSAATPEELAALAAECLTRLEPGRQPLPLFTQLGRLTVLSTVEIVPLRASSSILEVLLAPRPATDPWWPNQWHLPGSVLLPSDAGTGIGDYDAIADRILGSEFRNTVARKGNVHVFDAKCRSGVRGSEQTVFGWTEVDLAEGTTKPFGGRFFEAKRVLTEPFPADIIVGHDETIRLALADYRLSQSQVA